MREVFKIIFLIPSICVLPLVLPSLPYPVPSLVSFSLSLSSRCDLVKILLVVTVKGTTTLLIVGTYWPIMDPLPLAARLPSESGGILLSLSRLLRGPNRRVEL